MGRERRRRENRGGAKRTEITAAEREVIIENLIHDLAAFDSTTEAEAAEIHARLVAEGRIDLEQSAASHQRLLARLRKRA